jgi:hypothetical protein
MSHRKIFITIILFSICIKVSAQELAEKALIGKWTYSKTVDKNDEELVITANRYVGSDGKLSRLITIGPEIEMNEDRTYIMKYKNPTFDIIEKGSWELIGNEIKFKIIIYKNSKTGLIRTESEQRSGKKREIDKNGDYLDVTTYPIIILKTNEMRIKYDNDLIQVYVKN